MGGSPKAGPKRSWANKKQKVADASVVIRCGQVGKWISSVSVRVLCVVEKSFFSRKICGFTHAHPPLGQLPKLIVNDLIQLYICRHNVGAGAAA